MQINDVFGELENIEPRLKALGVVEVDGAMVYVANEEADNMIGHSQGIQGLA